MGEARIELLIVDDEGDFLRAISRRLELRGFAVSQATNGPDALVLARDTSPDLALLDLKMPGMNGKEVLEALKKEHPHLESIILTGHGSIDSAVESRAAGAFGYLPKPYEMAKLLDTLAQAFEKRLRNQHADDETRIRAIETARKAGEALDVLRALATILHDD